MSYLNEYNMAVAQGFIPFFEEAAAKFQSTPDLLMGIASRESDMRNGLIGDKGNGYGLMQIDRRYFGTWVATGKYKDAREAIMMGAEVLLGKVKTIIRLEGHDIRHHLVNFTVPSIPEADVPRIAIAAYNAGEGGALHGYAEGKVDEYTTGGNYSADVLARALIFKGYLDAAK